MDYKKELVRIGQRIEELRKAHGWSIQELAYRCEMERSSVSEIEDGKVNMTFRTLCRVATGLDVSLGDLVR